jgi:hypothetical protein
MDFGPAYTSGMEEETTALAEIEPLPDILPAEKARWEKIQDSRMTPRMKRALRRVMGGMRWSHAAKLENVSRSGLHAHGRKHGISTGDRIIAGLSHLSDLCVEELTERVSNKPEKMSAKELGVVMGIATDKLAKKERWGTGGDDNDGDDQSPLMKLCQAAAEGRLDLSIKVRARDMESNVTPADDIIDVEPL